MYKLTVKLKQHTPLIHFQHEQHGATLRATELKPKLDRFLIKKLGITNGNIPKKYEDWFISTDKMALDYKVRIIAEKVDEKWIGFVSKNDKIRNKINDKDLLTGTAYFADNDKLKKGKFSECKKGLTFTKITCYFLSFNSNLINEIANVVSDFFILTNLGSRTSKGFGSFTVEKIEEKSIVYSTTDISSVLKNHYACVYLSDNKLTDLSDVNRIYQILKSGINKTPSSLEKYLWSGFKIDWEKYVVMEDLVQNINNPEERDYTKSRKYKFARAVLGLAGSYNYPPNHHHSQVETVTIKHVPQKKDEDTIERMQSPIFFKIIDKAIYLCANKTYQAIENKVFKFSSEMDKVGIEMKTINNFDIKDFLEKHLSKNWTQL